MKVEHITNAAGTAKGNFYRYFASVDELLVAVRDHLLDQYIAALVARREVDPDKNAQARGLGIPRSGTSSATRCIADRYAGCMVQLVTRVDDDLAAAIDEMVDAGVVASRSEAVRLGLKRLVDRHQRDVTGARIVEGYRRRPQTDAEVGWADEATVQMISDEPW